MPVDDGRGISGFQFAHGFGAGGRHHVAADQQPCAPGGDADRVQVFRVVGDADVGINGTVLLRQSGDVEDGNAFALKMGGHGQNRADGNDPGAANSGDDNTIGIGAGGHCRFGQRLKRLIVDGRGPFGTTAIYGDESRAETIQA